MPINFRCLFSNASGLIFQSVSQYTVLDIFWGVGLQWLQWQSEIASLSGLYCASTGEQGNEAGSLGVSRAALAA